MHLHFFFTSYVHLKSQGILHNYITIFTNVILTHLVTQIQELFVYMLIYVCHFQHYKFLKRNSNNSLHIIEHNPESSVPFITGGSSVSFLPTNRGFNCTDSTPGGGGS